MRAIGVAAGTVDDATECRCVHDGKGGCDGTIQGRCRGLLWLSCGRGGAGMEKSWIYRHVWWEVAL